MKSLFAGMAAMTVAVLCGCTQGTPGGPGTTDVTVEKPVYGQTDDTFNLSVPVMSTTVKQGEQQVVVVGIDRAQNFAEDVTLKFGELPAGVTITPDSPVIRSGDKDAKVTLAAAADAALGDFAIKLTGHPGKGDDSTNELKFSVVAP